MLGGVCGGIARSAGLDPLLLRVAVVAVTVLTVGAGALAYLAAWVVLRREAAAPGAADVAAGTGTEPPVADIPAPRSPLPWRRPAGSRVRSP